MQGEDGSIVHVIDDDAAVRESLEALLTLAGFDVVTHDSAEAFLAHGSKDRGCVLLDVNMPGMTGLQLLEHLGREGIDSPVVILTANRDERVRERAHELGARGFLVKPVTEQALVTAILAAQSWDEGKPVA